MAIYISSDVHSISQSVRQTVGWVRFVSFYFSSVYPLSRLTEYIHMCIKYIYTICYCIRLDCAFDTHTNKHRSSNHPSFIILFQSNIPTWNSFHLLSLFSSVWFRMTWTHSTLSLRVCVFSVAIDESALLSICKYFQIYSNLFDYVSRQQNWNHTQQII